MAKRPFRGKTTKKKVPNNPNQMMAQVQQMQADMAKAQEDLENEYITVSAGGGAISIEISGHQRIRLASDRVCSDSGAPSKPANASIRLEMKRSLWTPRNAFGCRAW